MEICRKRTDAETGFVYFGHRYYDPELCRWLTTDPAGFVDGMNLYVFNFNNPLRYVDKDGRIAFLFPPILMFAFGVEFVISTTTVYAVASTLGTLALSVGVYQGIKYLDQRYEESYKDLILSDQAVEEEEKKKEKTHYNPYDGPVKGDVMVVDEKGNVIPVKNGQYLTGSSDGKWTQVRESDNKPTGLRKDGAHNPLTHDDERALVPHAHVPGITNDDGTPWMQIKH